MTTEDDGAHDSFRLRVKNLGKTYRIYKKPYHLLKDIFLRQNNHEVLQALQDINFTLSPGDSLGVIGENGAGKTTLLQLLSGAISPTSGKIKRDGRIGAIIELGSGLHGDLTGIENIHLGCAMLGMTPDEAEENTAGIIAFSELDEYITRPVRTYSSGMLLRLAFSIATSIEPDILIIDEALSVGDQHFQKKCVDRIMAFQEKGTILIICSHNMYYIQHLCKQALWLRDGRIEAAGLSIETVKRYIDYERGRGYAKRQSSSQDHEERKETASSPPSDYIKHVTLGGDCREGVIPIEGCLLIQVTVILRPKVQEEGAHLVIVINREDGIQCYGVSTEYDDESLYRINDEEYGIVFVIDNLPLMSGQYNLDVVLLDNHAVLRYDYRQGVSPFQVRQDTKEIGICRISHHWARP